MTDTFAPGPWKAVDRSGKWVIQATDGETIATLGETEESRGLAKLITASPYLLEALRVVAELMADEDLPDNGEMSGAAISDMVRAALQLASC